MNDNLVSSERASSKYTNLDLEVKKALYDLQPPVLGERLRRARQDKKISQRDLCNGLFTSAYLSSVELGKTRPTAHTLIQLAERLDKSVEFFLRPSSTLVGEVDQELANVLDLRHHLLAAQVRLASAVADERAGKILDHLASHLDYLNKREQARYHYLTGRFYRLQGNFVGSAQALEQAQQCLGEATSTEPELRALICNELGLNYYRQGQVMQSLHQFLTGLALFEETENWQQGEAIGKRLDSLQRKLSLNAANSYLFIGDWQQAQAQLEKALAPQTEASPQAEQFYSLATSYSEEGDFQQASLNLGRSMQIFEQSAEQAQVVNAYNALAELQSQTGQVEAAEQRLEDVLKGKISPPDTSQRLRSLVTLAAIRLSQERLEEAMSYIEKALREQENCPEQSNKGRLYQVAAEVEAALGHRQQAEECYRQALKAFEGTDDVTLVSGLADVYHSYGQQLRKWGDFDRAFEFLEKAYQQRERERGQLPVSS